MYFFKIVKQRYLSSLRIIGGHSIYLFINVVYIYVFCITQNYLFILYIYASDSLKIFNSTERN